MTFNSFLTQITFSTLIFIGAGSTIQAQLPKGDRILAWQVDMAENADYPAAYNVATTACMESIHVFFTWTALEVEEGNFLEEGISNLDIINIYHPLNGIKAELQIAPVNTVAKEVPNDLAALPFDSPTVINRFKALLDTVFTHIPALELSSLNIGNESDIFFGTEPTQYNEFKTFLNEVVPYAQELYFNIHQEELKVGTVLTHAGLVNPSTAGYCSLLNEGLDVVSTTYYPLNGDFTMKSPDVVSFDFEELVAHYPDTSQPIYFTECGYSSSEWCNSSEEQQSQFYTNVFQAWDAHYDNIKYLTIFKTTDWSSDEVDTFTEYYGIETIEFIEYLRALGLRTWDGDGTDKLAYDQVKCELSDRNWCDVNCAIQSTPKVKTTSEISIFPNPTSGLVQFISETDSKSDFQVIDQTGRLLLSGNLNHQKEIDLSLFPSGIYYVNFFSGEHRTTKKLVVL